jgi:uncharacterized membrane protein
MEGVKGRFKIFLEKISKINKNIWFILIFFSSFFLYLHNITFSDMWIDEAFTHALAKHSLGEIAGLVHGDYHPPLYFYGLKIFVFIFGVSVFTIRFFSTLGVLSTILLGYFGGQRLFGKSGALYFCLLMLSLPMLAAYALDARMYSWGAFAVTGVFLYAALFITSNKKRDLLILMLFSLIAAYTHYYGLVATLLANVFVLIYLLLKKNSSWKIHLIYSSITALLYLPWLFTSLTHLKKVEGQFWVPDVTWDMVLSCFIAPFAHKFWFPTNWELVVIIYALTLWVIYRNFIVRKDHYGIIVGLALFIFCFTVLLTGIISLIYQPILYTRYIMNIVVMLLVPPAVFFLTVKNKWIKGALIIVILFFGIKISIEASNFSYGPYQQSLEYLHKTYPDTKKIFHVLELTAGPFVEYNRFGFENFWFKPESTIVYTNMDVFDNLHTTDAAGKVLKQDEAFCVANFPFMPFNENNLKKILSESRLIKIDTVFDNKVQWGNSLLLYILKYNGLKPEFSQ